MGRFAGAVISYVVVGAILLAASPPLGWLVLAGGPVMLASLTLIVRPLQRRQALQREEAGRLTTLGADTVAGLRVLRGIGGEQTFLRRYEQQSQRVRERGVHVAGIQAALDSAQVLLPGIFVVLVTWLGARQAVVGEITAGQLVAFYGYTAFLTMPLQTAIEIVDRGIRAHIAAGKVLRILAVTPDHDPTRAGTAAASRGPTPTWPTRSRAPSCAAACSPRSSRRGPRSRRRSPTGSAATAPARTRPRGVARASTTLPSAEVRRHVVVSEPDPRLFTGRPARPAPRRRCRVPVPRPAAPVAPTMPSRPTRACSGALSRRRAPLDVLDALPDGLDGTRRGARPVLLRRPAPAARAGPCPAHRCPGPRPRRADQRGRRPHRGPDRRAPRRPPPRPHHRRDHREPAACSGHADEVVLLEDGLVVARGTHRDLLEPRRIPPRRDPQRGGRPVITDHARRTLPVADSPRGLGAHP